MKRTYDLLYTHSAKKERKSLCPGRILTNAPSTCTPHGSLLPVLDVAVSPFGSGRVADPEADGIAYVAVGEGRAVRVHSVRGGAAGEGVG